MSIESIASDFNAGVIGGGEAVMSAMAEGYSYSAAVSALTDAITSTTPAGTTYDSGSAQSAYNQPESNYPTVPIPGVGYAQSNIAAAGNGVVAFYQPNGYVQINVGNTGIGAASAVQAKYHAMQAGATGAEVNAALAKAGIPEDYVAGPTNANPPTPTFEAVQKKIKEFLQAGDTASAMEAAKAWYVHQGHDPASAHNRAMALINSQANLGPDIPTGRPYPTGPQLGGVYPGGRTLSEYEKISAKFGLPGVFQSYLQDVVPDLTSRPEAIQHAYSGLYKPLETTFLLSPEFYGGNEKKPTFQDFLQSGQAPFSPEQARQRLVEVGKFVPGGPDSTEAKEAQYETFGGLTPASDNAAFAAMMAQYLRNIDPSLRGAVAAGTRRFFDTASLRTPDLSFVKLLANMPPGFWGG